MTEKLMEELQKIGLTLTTKNIKILTTNPNDEYCTLNFVEIGNEFVKELSDTDSHRFWDASSVLQRRIE